MRLLFQDLDLSLQKQVTALFTAPPAGQLTTPWHVYGEDEFMSPAHTPVFPYVYLLNKPVRPQMSKLPLVIIARGATPHLFYEVGNPNGHLPLYNLHVFARTRGERAFLAAFLETNLEALSLYHFPGGADPVLVETTTVLSRSSVPVDVAPEVGIEGTLQNFETVILDFMTLN